MRKKFLQSALAVTLTAALSLSAAGCANNPAKSGEGAQTAFGERSVTVVDMAGNTVTVTGEVKRIVNLWPSVTAGLLAFGAGDLIVGMAIPGSNLNAWSKYLCPNCANIPGLGGTALTIENIINLNPDLVICSAGSATVGCPQQLNAIGIPAVVLRLNSFDDMKEGWTILGKLLGGEYPKKISDWCNEIDARLANVRGLTSGIAEADRPVVFVSQHSSSLVATWAANSLHSDWVESAGGRFASNIMKLAGAEVTAEAIFTLNPDVFIYGSERQHVARQEIKTTAGWKDLNAVVNGRVYGNPFAFHDWQCFGSECLLQINYAFYCIQPEIAAANGINRETLIDELIGFYDKYTGIKLTRQIAGYMFDGLTPDGKMEIPLPAS
jgi:ABC-type Fe3+-hydroxamate transport system substrate-binding protein